LTPTPVRSRAAAAPVTTDEIERLFAGLEKARGIVAAVSGGPDSTCLMHCLAAWRGGGERPPIVVATVDHGLRQDSAGEARQVGRWAKALGFRHKVLTWQGDKPETGLQEAAREERYRLLADRARTMKASHVVTAHTLDDQAETVVMRLVRGTGIGGLAGMRPALLRDEITLSRPFLGLAKARLIATCAAAGWPYLDDPSNADPRFARSRLRAHLMPLLAREGLTAERLASLAQRAGRDADALDARAIAALAEARLDQGEAAEGLSLDAARLSAEPDAILLRVVARSLAEVVGPRTRPVRLERFEARILGDLRGALNRGGALRINLGGALLHLRPDGRLTVRPEPPRGASKNKASLKD
jgi:tRNA(Ile)-lysidine synthase